jgi:hypothetical protein
MDERIESFLADVLALEGEDENSVREGVRVALAGAEPKTIQIPWLKPPFKRRRELLALTSRHIV